MDQFARWERGSGREGKREREKKKESWEEALPGYIPVVITGKCRLWNSE